MNTEAGNPKNPQQPLISLPDNTSISQLIKGEQGTSTSKPKWETLKGHMRAGEVSFGSWSICQQHLRRV